MDKLIPPLVYRGDLPNQVAVSTGSTVLAPSTCVYLWIVYQTSRIEAPVDAKLANFKHSSYPIRHHLSHGYM